MGGVLDDAEIARHGRNPGRSRRLFRLNLVAHRGDGAGVGADENNAGRLQRVGEGLALGEEAIARMHRLRPRRLAGGDDLVDDEIGLGRSRRPDMHCFVGHLDMQRVLVGVRINRNSLDAHAPGGLDNPAGNFAAVGDEDFGEHQSPDFIARSAAAGWRFALQRAQLFIRFLREPSLRVHCAKSHACWSTSDKRSTTVSGARMAPGAITAFAPIRTLSPINAPNLASPVSTH